MIGLDTNIIIRYLTRDDEEQYAIACDLLHAHEKLHKPVHIAQVTLCETIWVLMRAYTLKRNAICSFLDKILSTPLFVIENKDEVQESLEYYRMGGGDFADYLTAIRS